MSKGFVARLSVTAVCFVTGILAACGGGGGSGASSVPPSLVVTSTTISVSATTAQAAPTAPISTHIAASPNSTTQYFFSIAFTSNGITSISNTGDGTAVNYTVQFKAPTSLAPGTYKDTVTIKACADSACSSPVANSPQEVAVNYVVSNATGVGTPAVLNAIGPNAVEAGGVGFTLVVVGQNFSTSSSVQWNGAALQTAYLSPTELNAAVLPSDIAVAGTATVTVANIESTGITVSNGLPLEISATSVPSGFSGTTDTITTSANTALGGGAIVNNPFELLVNGPTGTTYYYSVSFSGTAVASLQIDGEASDQPLSTPLGPSAGRITGFTSPGGGQTITGSFTGPTEPITQIILLNAAQLGAGTYTDMITIAVCLDAQCTKPIPGSPLNVTVNYTVSGNPIADTLFSLESPSLTVEAATSSAASPTATAVISSDGLPPYGAYVTATVGSGAAIASTSFQSNLDATGTLTVTFKPPADLGSGIYSDSVHLQICFDSACTKPANPGRFTLPVTYVVDASPGIDFTVQTIPNEIQEMVWSAAKQRIYAIVPSYAASNPNSLLVINPGSATIEAVVSLGVDSNPAYLSVSDDGQFAYVVAAIPNEIERVNLATLTIDETLPLPLTALCVGIAVAPAQPHTIAVAVDDANVMVLSVFDDAAQRAQTFSTGAIEIPLMFGWGADATTMYAYDESIAGGTMYQLAAAASGLSVSHQTAGIVMQESFFGDLQFVGGLVYSGTTGAFNPATGTKLPPYPLQSTSGNFVSSGSYTIDTTLNRLFATTGDQPLGVTNGYFTLESFNMTTLSPTWIARFQAGQGGNSLLRWGTNGLAFTSGGITAPTIELISGSIVVR